MAALEVRRLAADSRLANLHIQKCGGSTLLDVCRAVCVSSSNVTAERLHLLTSNARARREAAHERKISTSTLCGCNALFDGHWSMLELDAFDQALMPTNPSPKMGKLEIVTSIASKARPPVDAGIDSPGHIYELPSALAKQPSAGPPTARKRSAPTPSFSRHSRWADLEREARKNTVPGPGYYG